MQPFSTLTELGQLARLRRLGRNALARYPHEVARGSLRVIRHEHNATFRVDAPAGRSLLRINRHGAHGEAEVESEMAWLTAIRRDTHLIVPEPARAIDGSFVVTVEDPGIPEPRSCALLRWIDGRFIDRRLTPARLAAMGATIATLQVHAAGWTPPSGFIRPRLDGLANEHRRASVTGPGTPTPAAVPGVDDATRTVELVARLMSPDEAATAARTVDLARATFTTLSAIPGSTGLIHGDLHHENVVFVGGVAAAIDFDDCGWGFNLYDLAVPLSELTGRRRFPAMRDAMLDAYARQRPVPDRVKAHLDALIAHRGLQLIVWILESRDHPAFRDRWRTWAQSDLAWLAGWLETAERAR